MKRNKGFTLVELIVIIVILAVLLGVTLLGVASYTNKARKNTDINNASTVQTNLGSHFLTGSYWNSPKFKKLFKKLGNTFIEDGSAPDINDGHQVYILRWNDYVKSQFEKNPSYADFPTAYYKTVNINYSQSKIWFVWNYLSYSREWNNIPTQNVLKDIPIAQQDGYEFYFLFYFGEEGSTVKFECICAKQEDVWGLSPIACYNKLQEYK